MFSVVKHLKTPETKLVVVKIEVSRKCLITSIRIEGDYFASNPKPIDDLMKTKLSMDEPSVIRIASEALEEAGVYGASIPQIIKTLREALEEARMKCASMLG